VNNRHASLVKKNLLREWHLQTLTFGRAQAHYEFELKRSVFGGFCEGVLVQQIQA